jgi:hypothetical protein
MMMCAATIAAWQDTPRDDDGLVQAGHDLYGTCKVCRD